MLVNALRRNGQREVVPLDDPADLPEIVWQLARPGDLVVCLGAGNITNWAYALPAALQKIADDRGGLHPVANDRGHA